MIPAGQGSLPSLPLLEPLDDVQLDAPPDDVLPPDDEPPDVELPVPPEELPLLLEELLEEPLPGEPPSMYSMAFPPHEAKAARDSVIA